MEAGIPGPERQAAAEKLGGFNWSSSFAEQRCTVDQVLSAAAMPTGICGYANSPTDARTNSRWLVDSPTVGRNGKD